MPLDVSAIQTALREDGLDAWLLYDFHGSNPIARRLAGLDGTSKMTTRRWYYLIPRTGTPVALVHAIERHTLDGLPGDRRVYASRESLVRELEAILAGGGRVAMEYSPECAIPYISRVDGGTVDLVRRMGAEVVSSGDLVQRFEARWDSRALASHREAAEALYRIKDRAFATIADLVGAGKRTTEFEIQQLMWQWFAEEGLVSDSAPCVAAQEHAGDPHYQPTAEATRTIGPDELVLLDLWGKRTDEGAVFADITWVGYTGSRVPGEMARAFAAIREARDTAVALVRDRVREGRDVRGWEVDRAARGVLERAGFGAQVLHRTGHSLGQEVHGNGVHLDDYETHDDRRLLPGTCVTVEPGLYFSGFGVRTEINLFVDTRDVEVTGPAQDAIVTLR